MFGGSLEHLLRLNSSARVSSLSTIHPHPHGYTRMTRGDVVRYSFTVWNFHPLLLAGLPGAIALGMPVARHPPHRSQRAELPHWAPTSGIDAQALCLPYPYQHMLHVSPASVSGTWFVDPDSPLSVPFPPLPPHSMAHHRPCSEASLVLWNCLTSHVRSSLPYSLRILSAGLAFTHQGQTWDLPVPVQRAYVRARGL